MVAGLSHLWKIYPQMISKPDKKGLQLKSFSVYLKVIIQK